MQVTFSSKSQNFDFCACPRKKVIKRFALKKMHTVMLQMPFWTDWNSNVIWLIIIQAEIIQNIQKVSMGKLLLLSYGFAARSSQGYPC